MRKGSEPDEPEEFALFVHGEDRSFIEHDFSEEELSLRKLSLYSMNDRPVIPKSLRHGKEDKSKLLWNGRSAAKLSSAAGCLPVDRRTRYELLTMSKRYPPFPETQKEFLSPDAECPDRSESDGRVIQAGSRTRAVSKTGTPNQAREGARVVPNPNPDRGEVKSGMLTVDETSASGSPHSEDAEKLEHGTPEQLSGASTSSLPFDTLQGRDIKQGHAGNGSRGATTSTSILERSLIRQNSGEPTTHEAFVMEMPLVDADAETILPDGWPAKTNDGEPIPFVLDLGNGDQQSRREEIFGKNCLGFPTRRVVSDYRRKMSTVSEGGVQEWLKSQHEDFAVASMATDEERSRIGRLLFTWKDLFVESVRHMPATDLVTHDIPTYPTA